MSPQDTPVEPKKASPTAPANSQRQDQPEKLRFLENDAARTGFDPKTAWWVSLFKIWMGNTTPEGAFHYREWRTRVNEQRDCKRCEGYRDHLFKHSPVVRFMSDKIKDLNGNLDAENVRCRRCVTKITEDGKVARQGGGFSPNHGILICANEVRNRGHLEDTLTHEMVHAWDYLRFKVDFVGEKDLKHAACTEVREAAKLKIMVREWLLMQIYRFELPC